MAEIEIVPGAPTPGYAIGEFLCPGCGGIANVMITAYRPDPSEPWNDSSPSLAWHEPWQEWVTVELICQGPPLEHDESGWDDDPRWDHAGTSIDMLDTGYEPICLN